MRDQRDSLDLTVGPSGATASDAAPAFGGAARPYLQLWFRCAGQYVRAYRNADGTGYMARCPSCGKPVRFRVGPGGTSERCFEIGC